ncbi:polar amino acid transport system permease protein [Pseudochelatococcus lubricantis]|uniref:Polar amino acid transport system permease protein n=1 Tax=Pseudochelatococcus lubricantis TaxID=1538102 RepID=A0ABX0UU84_9HYPH|nr:polar amino acid transport system permease protein [Pseudochelatococcus lubricantis]
MNFDVVLNNLPYLLWGAWPQGPIGGAALTVWLSLLSGVASAVIGLVLGIWLYMSRGAVHSVLILFLGFFRAIPVLMLIFWTYFLLPVVLGFSVPELTTVVCALALIGGAYLAHSVAAGLRSVGGGQWEAGISLGLGRWRVLWLIVLPQSLRRMAPSFVNQWISLIKDTSLAYVIGVPELSFVATQVNNRAMVYPAEIFLFVAFVYFVICGVLDLVATAIAGEAEPEARTRSV